MRTITDAVEQVIRKSPFLIEVLTEGVGNHTAIARKIKPDVEAYLYEKVTLSSISMALHRLSKSLEKPQSVSTFIKDLNDITVRSNLIEYVFPNKEVTDALSKALLHSQSSNGGFFTYSRGILESAVVIQTKHEEGLQKYLQKMPSIQKVEKLSAITIRLPKETLTTPGVYYPILKIFAQAKISFVEVISIATEFTILFDDRDIDRAFAEFKRTIS